MRIPTSDGLGYATVTYDAPITNDNVGVRNMTCSHPVGKNLSSQAWENYCTVTDAAGLLDSVSMAIPVMLVVVVAGIGHNGAVFFYVGINYSLDCYTFPVRQMYLSILLCSNDCANIFDSVHFRFSYLIISYLCLNAHKAWLL